MYQIMYLINKDNVFNQIHLIKDNNTIGILEYIKYENSTSILLNHLWIHKDFRGNNLSELLVNNFISTLDKKINKIEIKVGDNFLVSSVWCDALTKNGVKNLEDLFHKFRSEFHLVKYYEQKFQFKFDSITLNNIIIDNISSVDLYMIKHIN